MCKRTKRRITVTALCVSALFAISAQAEPVNEVDPQADARQAYDHLLKEYVAGKTGIDRLELLYNWSLRVASVDFDMSACGQKIDLETPMKSLRQHVSRMKQLEQRVLVLARAGSVPSAELAAARYLHWQATRIEPQIQEQIKQKSATTAIPMLPSPASTPLGKNALVIIIDAEGNTFIDNVKLSAQQLRGRLQQHAASGNTDGILIKASGSCREKYVSQVAMLCDKIEGCRLVITVLEEE
ncbi:MAG: hypothetical protein JW719_07170 [Pirellulales bacterium]|nr:hypothetical protein [Pirellulales bacterium]